MRKKEEGRRKKRGNESNTLVWSNVWLLLLHKNVCFLESHFVVDDQISQSIIKRKRRRRGQKKKREKRRKKKRLSEKKEGMK